MKYTDFKREMAKLPLFSSSMLGGLTGSSATLRVQLAQWKKKGRISSLRKGVYVLNKEDRKIEPTRFYLANQIFIPSYVSLESALAYYGLIPEYVGVTTSVTVRNTRRFQNEFGVFVYRHLKPKAYTGFVSRGDGSVAVLIAAPEKAVVDFIYLNLEKFDKRHKGIFEGSYRFQNGRSLVASKLVAFAELFSSKKLLTVTQSFIEEIVR